MGIQGFNGNDFIGMMMMRNSPAMCAYSPEALRAISKILVPRKLAAILYWVFPKCPILPPKKT